MGLCAAKAFGLARNCEVEGAAFYTNVSQVGKSTHAKGTAAAHLRYVRRKAAVSWELSENFPEDYVEQIKFIHRRERDIRKNGQVFTKVIVNLPYALNDEQRKGLVHDVCQKVGLGRIPYLAVCHSDTKAPHAHIIFVDADIDTGKRVFGFSKSGALFRWRGLWEDATNQHLAAAGSTYRISRWGKDSQHHKQLNDQAIYEGTSKRTEYEIEPLDMPIHVAPKPKEERVSDKLSKDDDFRNSVQGLLHAKQELHAIETAVRAAAQNKALKALVEQRIKANDEAALRLTETTKQRNDAAFAAWVYYREYGGVMGGLKNLFSRGYKGRRQNAWLSYAARMRVVERANASLKEAEAEGRRLNAELASLTALGFGIQKHLNNIGDKEEIADLETMHRANLWHHADRIEQFYQPKLEDAYKKGEISKEAYEKTQKVMENRRNNLLNRVADGYKH